MTRPLTVLIVGGYGTFGGRLARLLSDVDGLTLLVGGRSLARAEAFCAAEPGLNGHDRIRQRTEDLGARGAASASMRPVVFDRGLDVVAQLRSLAPDVVVDASGPFQAYGASPYALVEACIECGVHYLDLADSADFVCGIGKFDEVARSRGVFVLSGVSSFPVLTAAVVRLLSADGIRVNRITAGIAPSPFANVGLNVIRAIAGYAGKPVHLRSQSAAPSRPAIEGFLSRKPPVGHALTNTLHYTIAAPGVLPLHSTTFSLVDVPDLRLLAEMWPECQSVWMGAGPVPAVWHRTLRALAWLVRLRLIPSLSFMAPLMYWAINRLSWGEHRGGMFVRVEGSAAGANVDRSWHLIAEGKSGPLIPSMAAEAVIRRLISDVAPEIGARPAIRELEVSDYAPLLARHQISFGVRDDTLAWREVWPLYRRVLGEAWHTLPPTIRAMHSGALTAHEPQGAPPTASLATDARATIGAITVTARGRADVTRGSSLLARLVASIVGFPRPGKDVPVEVRFDVNAGRELWTRTFAGQSFTSEQFAGTGRFHRLICERFGPITLALAVVVANSRLRLIVRGWSFLGIPLPRALAPTCDAYESEANDRFRFNVAISHRLTGLIIHYQGWLIPEPVR